VGKRLAVVKGVPKKSKTFGGEKRQWSE
jgi:hypothetical protein